eukprot:6109518-Amphidinium_carterae.2
MEDFRGNQEANVVANLGAAEHEPHESSPGFIGSWSLRRSDTSGSLLARSVLRCGLVSGSRHLPDPPLEFPAEGSLQTCG